MTRLRFEFRIWVVAAIAVTLLCGLLYTVVQTDLRTGADDPQWQLAQDGAAALERGTRPEDVLPRNPVDLRTSLAPFLVVYDSAGQAVAGSGELDGKMPAPPPGVFSYTQRAGHDRLTWQPATGVREATVVYSYRAGFVLAGRSLRLAEQRIDELTLSVGGGWLATLGACAIVCLRPRDRGDRTL